MRNGGTCVYVCLAVIYITLSFLFLPHPIPGGDLGRHGQRNGLYDKAADDECVRVCFPLHSFLLFFSQFLIPRRRCFVHFFLALRFRITKRRWRIKGGWCSFWLAYGTWHMAHGIRHTAYGFFFFLSCSGILDFNNLFSITELFPCFLYEQIKERTAKSFIYSSGDNLNFGA